MADNADGRVIIDTELDNEGFESGYDRLKKVIESLINSVKRVSDAAKKSLTDTKGVDTFAECVSSASRDIAEAGKELSSVHTDEDSMSSRALEQGASNAQRAVESLTESLRRMANTSMQGFSNTRQVLAFSENIEEAEQKLASAKRELAEFAQQQIPTDDYQYVVEKIDKAEKALLKLYERQDMMEDMGVDENSKQWQRLQLQIKSAEEEVERFEIDADRMRETGKAFVDPKATEQFQTMRTEVEKQEKALQTSKNLIQQEAVEQAKLNVQAAQEKLATASSAKEREKAMQELLIAQNELKAAAAQSTTPKPDEEAVSKWQKLKSVLGGVGKAALTGLKGIGSIYKSVFSGIASGAKKAISALGKFSDRTKTASFDTQSLLRGIRSLKQMLISRVKNTFISFLSSTISDSIKALAKFDARFDEAVSNLRNRTAELGANVTVALGGLIRQIEPIVTAMIETVSRAVEKLNAVIAALRGEEVMVVAARRTESYAASLDDAANSAKKAKAAQDNLNTTLSSYDEIHKLSDDKTDLSSLIDSADAENAVFEAVPVEAIMDDMSDFGEGIVEQLLNGVRSGDWFAVGAALSRGVNAAVDSALDFIETIRPKAEQLAENLAKGLSAFIYDFDAYKLGNLIAEGFNTAFGIAGKFIESFRFDLAGARFGDMVTGVFKNIEWENIASTIAGAINGAVDFALNFLEHLDPVEIGKDIAAFFNKLVEKIDWDDVKATLSTASDTLFTTITTFLSEIDWDGASDITGEDIGKAIAEGINKAVSHVGEFMETALEDAGGVGESIATGLGALIQNTDWKKVGTTLGDAVMIVVENLFNFSEDFDWAATGEALGASFNGLVERIDWGKVAKTLSNAITGILKTITSFLEETDFVEVGKALAEFFTNIDYSGIVSALASGIGAAIGSIGQLLAGVFSTLTDEGENIGYELFSKYGEEAGNSLLGGFRSVFIGIDDWCRENISDPLLEGIGKSLGIDGFTDTAKDIWAAFKAALEMIFNPAAFALRGEKSPLEQLGDDIGEGLKTGIANAFKKMSKWTQDNIVEPFVEGIKKVFGIASPAKEMNPYGEYIGEGILDGIAGVFEKIQTWCTDNIVRPLKNALNKAFSVVSGAARAVSGTGESIAAGIKGGISDKWSTITSFFEEKKSDLVTAGEGLADKVKEGISGAWDRVKQAFGGGVDDLKNADTSGFDSIGESIANGVKSGIEQTDFTESGAALTDSIKDGMTGSKWDELVGRVWERFGGLREWMNTTSRGEFEDSGRNIAEGINDGLRSGLSQTQEIINSGMVPAAAVDAFNAYINSGAYKNASRNAVRGIAKSISTEARRSPVEMPVNTMTDGLDAVAEKLSAIAQQFIAIGRTITDIRYPAVAMGTVVPARTVVQTNSSGTDNTALIEKLVQKIDDLQRAIDGRPIQVESRVDIDGREIGRAVSNYNNSTSRIGNGGVYR